MSRTPPLAPLLTHLLVGRLAGDCGIVLACPHDGEVDPQGVTERVGPAGPRSPFRTALDRFTRAVTLATAVEIVRLTCRQPALVIAEFHRKFVDVNRPPAEAYEEPAAAVYYDEYHRALRAAVDAARVAGGILIDIHGAAGGGAGAADLYLGTLDGASARGVWRDGGFGTALVTAGYTVFPPASGVPELAAMRGGYTTQRYGRHNAGGIDAVQVEITQSLRFGSAARESVARALARGALAHLTPHNVG